MEKFKAYRLSEVDRKIKAEFVECTLDDLDPGEVVVRVAYSDVNYKDALAATGKGRILLRPVCIGGIDFAGTVVSSSDPAFTKGDAVLATGFDLGVKHHGGYAEYARVPADWLVKIPQGMTLFDAMAFERELLRSKSSLENLLGEPLRWLRFPYGERGAQRCRDIQQRYGVRAAHWTYSSHDSRAQNPLDVRTRVAVGLRPGAIVLFHDALADADRVQAPYVADRSATVLALPHIGADLRANRLRGVTLSELMR